MKLELSIYDHGVVMQVMFLQDILSNRAVIAPWFSKCKRFFLSSAINQQARNFMKLILSKADDACEVS